MNRDERLDALVKHSMMALFCDMQGMPPLDTKLERIDKEFDRVIEESNLRETPEYAALRQSSERDAVVEDKIAFAELDDRPLPSYGQIPWRQLGRDVVDARYAKREDYPFDPSYYEGHQMVPPINFNSLARIVDKYRYYGIAIRALKGAKP